MPSRKLEAPDDMRLRDAPLELHELLRGDPLGLSAPGARDPGVIVAALRSYAQRVKELGPKKRGKRSEG